VAHAASLVSHGYARLQASYRDKNVTFDL